MTPENKTKLRERYPLVFGRPFLNNEPFRCDDGWFDILDQLGAELTALIGEWPEEDRADLAMCQVKEKFGGLRAYPFGGAWPPGMGEAISRAESRSYATCEVCGKPGTTQTIRFVKTVCGQHFGELVNKFASSLPGGVKP